MTKRNSKGQFAKAAPLKDNERPIEDWLGELPEPYRAQALEAWKKRVKEGKPVKHTALSLHLALLHGFVWEDTPQKGSYWNAVYKWAADPAKNALPQPWQPPATAPKAEQDRHDALITEYHLSVSKVTKSVVEMSDKLDQIQRDIEQVRTLAHQTRTNSRGNTLVINKILAGVDLLKSGSSFMQEVQQHKEQPWVPKVGDHVRFKSEIGLTRQGHGILREIHEERGGKTACVVDFDGYGSGTWWVDDLRPATPAEIERHQAELKAKEEEKKRKKLVRGCRVGTPDGEGIYLGDDGDGDGCEPHRASLDLDGPGVVRAYNLDQITPLP